MRKHYYIAIMKKYTNSQRSFELRAKGLIRDIRCFDGGHFSVHFGAWA